VEVVRRGREGAGMRCRHCQARFDLLDSVDTGDDWEGVGTPGRGLYVVGLLSLLVIIPSFGLAWLLGGPPYGLFVGEVGWFLLIWGVEYHTLLYDYKGAGTCPQCKKHNRVWPWST
jgi:hypothetical protein